MRRLFKWLGIALLALLFLAAATLGAAYYYKSDILEAINQALRKNINGEVSLGGLTFSLWDEYPGLSITLHDIYLRGPHYTQYNKGFFGAKKVYISVRLVPLLRKSIVVRSIHVTQGAVFMFRTKSGYTNLDVFKSDKDTDTVKNENPVLVSFRKLRLEDVQFSFQDSLRKKSVGLHFIDLRCQISETDSSSSYSLTGPVKFEGIMLNPAKGSFLNEKRTQVEWNLEFRPVARQLIIHPSTMEFSRSNVNLSGGVDFVPPGKFHWNIASDKLDYEDGISFLTQALQTRLKKVEIEKPVSVTTRVKGQFALATPPRVDVTFQFSKSRVRAFAIAAEQVTADGSFSNHADSTKVNDDRNSKVTLNSVEGVFQGLPTRLTATFHNLKDPQVALTSLMDVKATDFNALLDTSRWKFSRGTFTSHIEYAGKLNEFLDSTKTKFDGKLTGSAQLKDGAVRYLPRGQVYEKVTVSVKFDQDHVDIEDIRFILNKSPVSLKGEVLGFVPFFVLPEKKGLVRLSVYSPSLDLALVFQKEPTRKDGVSRKDKSRKKVSDLIDRLSEKVEFDLTVRLDRLSYQNLKGSNVKGKLLLNNNKLQAQNFKMNLAEGDIAFSLSLANLQKPVNSLSVTSIVRHADIKKFFYSFNNFKLTTITQENLEGRIDMKTLFRATVDADFSVFMPSVYGDLDLSIKNGKLINYEPLQNMSNFLFKRRDFNNVQFGEIRSHMTIRGTEIDIRKMEIESSVLRLFVEGRYSLKDNTDLEVQVPLSNLKKRNKNYKPENVGVDSRVGPSVFLHVYNSAGKTVIAYDPFKKHVKKRRRKQ
jgi:hypothetical protein